MYDFNVSIPSYIRYPSSYIINVGSHWVAVFIDEFQQATYFDSLGCPPPLRIQTFLNSVSKCWQFNRERIQSYTSSFCGHYCLLFIRHLSMKQDFMEFINKFKYSSELDKDSILYNMFIDCYGISKVLRIKRIMYQRNYIESKMNERMLWR